MFTISCIKTHQFPSVSCMYWKALVIAFSCDTLWSCISSSEAEGSCIFGKSVLVSGLINNQMTGSMSSLLNRDGSSLPMDCHCLDLSRWTECPHIPCRWVPFKFICLKDVSGYDNWDVGQFSAPSTEIKWSQSAILLCSKPVKDWLQDWFCTPKPK